MKKRDDLVKVVYGAIDDVNRLLPRECRLPKSDHTVIMGRKGRLDSLGLVNFIVALESRVASEFGGTISLTDAGIASGNSPLRTVGSLIDYLESALSEKSTA